MLADYVRENCPGAKLFLQQTWGYESGSDRIRQHGFETYDEMFARVMDCYHRAAKEIGADGIIPAGLAFRNALKKGIGRIHRDTFYASLGAGRFLLALVWYGHITERDISQVRFDGFDEPVEEREYRIVIEAAKESLAKYCLKSPIHDKTDYPYLTVGSWKELGGTLSDSRLSSFKVI